MGVQKEVCKECHQIVKQAHKETLNKSLLEGLQRAAKSIVASGVNDFDIHEIVDDYNLYNNFQKLRYFGLVHHVTDKRSKARIRGHWLITRNGWAFLRGDLNICKWVKIRNNHIIERSPETLSVKDVYRGSEYVVTTFEYFDDDGNMVGIRPMAAPTPPQNGTLFDIPPTEPVKERIDPFRM